MSPLRFGGNQKSNVLFFLLRRSGDRMCPYQALRRLRPGLRSFLVLNRRFSFVSGEKNLDFFFFKNINFLNT